MNECEHEFVSTEYMSQTYGHCLECGCTVIKNEEGSWVRP